MGRGDRPGPVQRLDDPQDHRLAVDFEQCLAGDAGLVAQGIAVGAFAGKNDRGKFGHDVCFPAPAGLSCGGASPSAFWYTR